MAATTDRDGHPAIGLTRVRPERTARDVRPALDGERIVRAAIPVADIVAPKAITMRRIAAKLDVGTMSLYWHYGSKEDLHDGIAARIAARRSGAARGGDCYRCPTSPV